MKKRTLAARFCALANHFLKDYRYCGGEITPAEMSSEAFWNRFVGTGPDREKLWQYRVMRRNLTSPKTFLRNWRNSLAQRANRIQGSLHGPEEDVRIQADHSAIFPDGSKAWPAQIPVVCAKGWYWGCNL